MRLKISRRQILLGLKRSDLLNWSWEGRVVGEGGGVGGIVGGGMSVFNVFLFLEEEDVFVLSSLLLCKVDMN